jgi:hypothetical protein
LTFPTLHFDPASHLIIATTSVNRQQPTGLHGLDVAEMVDRGTTELRGGRQSGIGWMPASLICGPIVLEQLLFAVPRLLALARHTNGALL